MWTHFTKILVIISLILAPNVNAAGRLIDNAGSRTSVHGTITDAQKVVKYLLSDWRKQFRSTDIATAMDNIGMKQDDEMRLQIGNYFRKNTGLAGNLRFWGPNNYLLNNTEKRITKYLIHKVEREGGYPTLSESVKELEIDERTLKDRMAFMKDAGLLLPANNDIRYTLIDRYKTWGGPLRYNYHTVSVEGEKPFGVW